MRYCECILVVQFFLGSITFLKKFIDYLKLFSHSVSFFIVFNPLFLSTQIFYNDFGLFCIVPKVRSKGFFFFVGYLN